MKTKLKNFLRLGIVSLIVANALALTTVLPVSAHTACYQDSDGTSHCDLIAQYVNPAINLLSVSFGIIAVISLIFGSINYTTSEGDPQKASKAKQRIANTLFATVAYMFLYAFLQFLVPGGIFHT
jgi:hypothetical protein